MEENDVPVISQADSNEVACQVCVLGAGPCGLALAAALVKRGLDVCVCEKNTEEKSGGVQYLLKPNGLAALQVRDWISACEIHLPVYACMYQMSVCTVCMCACVRVRET
jgi:2-polyprenyl-6-methoxyphenol hydroxylase-like FAD-dependent oxidoreductase